MTPTLALTEADKSWLDNIKAWFSQVCGSGSSSELREVSCDNYQSDSVSDVSDSNGLAELSMQVNMLLTLIV